LSCGERQPGGTREESLKCWNQVSNAGPDEGRLGWRLRPRPMRSTRVRSELFSRLLPVLAKRLDIQLIESKEMAAAARPSDSHKVVIHSAEAFYGRLAAGGIRGLGESYQDGAWGAEDLVGLLCRLLAATDSRPGAWLRALRPVVSQPRGDGDAYSLAGARQSISHHYDLSNLLFALFLDESMTYSSALFEVGDDGRLLADRGLLAAAQNRKYDRLLDLVKVGPGSRLLEIGTGWGGLAIRAAERGAQVRTVTISAEQLKFVQHRVRECGLESRITAELRDYRELGAGQYNAIISIEMIEAVGQEYWPTYFEVLEQQLAPSGRIGLQVITMRPDRFSSSRNSRTWVNEYVFPGFKPPSVPALAAALRQHSGLTIVDRMAFGPHFAETLRIWRESFTDAADEVQALGFGDVFQRTWEFYLASCEASFRAGHFDVNQFILAGRDAGGSNG
jgi:cyclopropane-fatty-acyl-phospholipid synthase